ncbi:hypothetical protein DFJ73DRAFT_772912 [Zopfochytrium polystomum]|nr:hypothetical protein DFJ73DRAFT_772912 [Zopfochytrium polystomum]
MIRQAPSSSSSTSTSTSTLLRRQQQQQQQRPAATSAGGPPPGSSRGRGGVSGLGNAALLLSLAALALVLVPLGWWNHAWLPAPVLLDEAAAGARFSEAVALNHTRILAEEIGFRMTGTVGEILAEQYIIGKLNEYKAIAKTNPNTFPSKPPPARTRTFFVGENVDKIYTNVTNIVVRISCGPACNENALLVNSHYDSQIGTPGATDDALGVFIMNSPLFKNIRAFLNLEAMGNDGKGILFQANARGLVDAYRRVGWKHGSVLSNDVFKIGLINSDTDFRQFVDHGGLVGLDFALYQNSYVYHTIMDTYSAIRPGVCQYIGETVTGLALDLIISAPIETFKMSRDFIYFDLLGLFFFVYDWSTATLLHAALIAVGAYVALQYGFGFARSDRQSAAKRRGGRSAAAVLTTFAAVAMSFIATLLAPAVLGAVFHFVLKTPMTWFKAGWRAMLLYMPTSAFALVGTQILTRGLVPTDPTASVERRLWAGMILLESLLLVIGTGIRFGSSYAVFLHLLCTIAGLALDRLLSFKRNAPFNPLAPIRTESYIVACLPWALLSFFARMAVTLFVPLTGRLGIETPGDIVLGFLAGLIFSVGSLPMMALSGRFSSRGLRRLLTAVAAGALAVAVVMANTFPFDEAHPKRLVIQYTRDYRPSAPKSRALDIADADPACMPLALSHIADALGQPVPAPQPAAARDVTWSPLYPLTRFVGAYTFDISDVPVAAGELPPPRVEVLDSVMNDAKGERTVTLQVYHPHHHWTTLVFNATLTSCLTYPVTAEQPNLTVTLAAVEKDTYQMSQLWEGGGNGGDGRWRWPTAGSGFASGEDLYLAAAVVEVVV